MKDTKNTTTAPVATAPAPTIDQFDEDLLYASDLETGERIKDEDVLKAARDVQKVEFIAAGKKHVVELVMEQVPFSVRRTVTKAVQDFQVEFGITGDEDLDKPEDREKVARFNIEAEECREILLARAEVALAAIKRDELGRLRVSIPHFRNGAAPEKLVDDEIFGRPLRVAAYVAVSRFFG